MKRTTIFMPESLEADLRSYARREKKPVAWVVREAVSRYLETNRKEWKMPSFVGIGASAGKKPEPMDPGDEFEAELFADLTPHDDRVRPPRRRRRPTAPAKPTRRAR